VWKYGAEYGAPRDAQLLLGFNRAWQDFLLDFMAPELVLPM
jgi:hypothetical protein